MHKRQKIILYLLNCKYKYMNIRTFLASAALALMSAGCAGTDRTPVNEMRPPAVPLVTVDPYFSIWSFADRLNERPTVHWTGHEHPLIAVVRVDGVSYRVMGVESPRYEQVVPTGEMEAWTGRYLIDKEPGGNWTAPDYNDSAWNVGQGAFGTSDVGFARTAWGENLSDIWVRREFELPEDFASSKAPLLLEYSHDDSFELYINGTRVAGFPGNAHNVNVRRPLRRDALALLKPGRNVMAAHCRNTGGGAVIDFGIIRRNDDRRLVTAAEQKSVNVLPTRTIYELTCGPVDLELSFAAPLFMEDLDLLSRPVNYLTYKVKSNDGAQHDVQIYLEGTPKLAVDTGAPAVKTETGSADGIDYVRTGTVEQNVLGRKGDNVRIDWGHFYIAVPSGKGNLAIADYYAAKEQFVKDGKVTSAGSVVETENFLRDNLSLVYCNDLGKVGSKPVDDYVMLAYDDVKSIRYFNQDLYPYWNRKGDKDIFDELADAASEYAGLLRKCEKFDRKMMDEAAEAGGWKYAELLALAYRQAITAHKLVEAPDGDLLFLSKENFSNGSIGTVDVTYPSAPLFLLYNPELCKGLLNHIFYYSESGKWTKPFAAHDVGTYPHANGQTYGGDMPVEECGNMVILTAAIAAVEGNAEYAAEHKEVLKIWTDYLVEYGLDPENQLCTDDFAGHFAHNANLSVKAILGVASYAKIAGMLGDKEDSEAYFAKAREMASAWKEMAFDGDHYKLTFDKPGTWSQKYNLVWDRLLGLNVFDPSITQTEIAWYLEHQNEYGLPLDSRREYTKTDWILWTATLVEDRAVFDALVNPVWNYYNETVDRVPMSDWVDTIDRTHEAFQARSVVGGFWIKMLAEELL